MKIDAALRHSQRLEHAALSDTDGQYDPVSDLLHNTVFYESKCKNVVN